jgi:glycine cleavage system P protein (glycine dehydrogenase) subunit 2
MSNADPSFPPHEPTLFEKSVPGRKGGPKLPACDVPETELPDALVREATSLPELSESEVVRHFLHLSQRNYGVDTGFYPLGSCTMKYNPKFSEQLARLPDFTSLHPLQDEADCQGALALMFALQEQLKEIGGFDAVSLQPAAGAQGELAALLMIRAYHHDRGDSGRNIVLVPDSAHGTNPASTTMAGFIATEVPSNDRGCVDLDAVRAACNDRLAGIMLTNPNTLGLFEVEVQELAELVHGCGAIVYGDGANMNALAGVVQPAALGIDLMHFNLHKTFATPHGGGGPGSGPIGACPKLAPYLPGPVVTQSTNGNENRTTYALGMPQRSIGRTTAFNGNFGMFVRAYAYLRSVGAEGLKQNALHAVLNANYLRVLLGDDYRLSFDRICMHEFVCEGAPKGSDVHALDVSKRLMDYGFHPPTNYFPLTVKEALMIEPTETETKRTLDGFADAMRKIADEARNDPTRLRQAPHVTPVRRLDEVYAARHLTVSDTTTRPEL